jgi:hypothetical protein
LFSILSFEWYSSCLRKTFENNEYEKIDSCEELMLEYTMDMLHGKKWDGEKWVKSLKGYEPKPGSNLYMGRQC